MSPLDTHLSTRLTSAHGSVVGRYLEQTDEDTSCTGRGLRRRAFELLDGSIVTTPDPYEGNAFVGVLVRIEIVSPGYLAIEPLEASRVCDHHDTQTWEDER